MKNVVNASKSRSKMKISKMGWSTYTAKNAIAKEISPFLNKDFWLKKKKKKHQNSDKIMRTWKNKFLSKDILFKKQNASITTKMILTYFVRKTRSSCALAVSHSIINIYKASRSSILKKLLNNLINCFHFFKI